MGSTVKIIDLNSANGTLVNGEQYAQLALKDGDIIELGHVRFRYVPPGSSYKFRPEDAEEVGDDGAELFNSSHPGDASTPPRGTPQSGASLAAIGLGLSILAVLALGAFWMFGGDDSEIEDDFPAAEAFDENSGVAGEGEGTAADKLVARAKEYMAKRLWDKARTRLDRAVALDPAHDEAIDLLEVVRAEAKARANIESANESVSSERWADAWNALSEIPESSVYFGEATTMRQRVKPGLVAELVADAEDAVRERDWGMVEDLAEEISSLDESRAERLREKLRNIDRSPRQGDDPSSGRQTARATCAQTQAGAPNNPASGSPPPTPPLGSPSPEALYQEGVRMVQDGKFAAAIERFSKCVQIDRSYCACFRGAGIANAKGGNGPKAARMYRLYLNCAPNGPDAAQVRAILNAYEAETR